MLLYAPLLEGRAYIGCHNSISEKVKCEYPPQIPPPPHKNPSQAESPPSRRLEITDHKITPPCASELNTQNKHYG